MTATREPGPQADPEIVRWRAWRNPGRTRLRQKVVETAAELEGLPAGAEARRYLRRAVAAANRGDVDEGWTLLGRVEESLILHSLPAESVRARARGLRVEAELGGKLNAWRRQAILDLVVPIADAGTSTHGAPATRLMLAAAVRLHNEGATNEYRRLGLLRRHQVTLVTASALVLAATVLLLARHAGAVADPASLQSSWALLTVLCLGVLGALTSAIQRSTQIPDDRIPRHIGTLTASLSRIPIGAVAALTVWLAFRAGSPPDSPVVAAMLVAGFGAGFTERLVTQDPGPGTPGVRS